MKPNHWQIPSPTNGLTMCWWTHPFLALADTWDWTGKTFLEFGAGLGTPWLRSKCAWVDSVESDLLWAEEARSACQKANLLNGAIFAAQLPPREQYFDLIPKDKQYDIVSVDGIFRNDCLQWAVDHLKAGGGLLIVDNMNQDYVWVSPKADEIMREYQAHIAIQPNHACHKGKPWNTRYYVIPKI